MSETPYFFKRFGVQGFAQTEPNFPDTSKQLAKVFWLQSQTVYRNKQARATQLSIPNERNLAEGPIWPYTGIRNRVGTRNVRVRLGESHFCYSVAPNQIVLVRLQAAPSLQCDWVAVAPPLIVDGIIK
ncbi:hypothetical protein GGX14DRAFT_401721 [Mycena pura]|uniref:Uncharacterized protein n=1 Tax=Mycena pura TaxID=153505 RepID=A0AAD6Y4D7_9AGAR|nr:hypothetical protein GGX14DRAFT_401721 [Mycena pura]